MIHREQLHGSDRLPHHTMWQSLDSGAWDKTIITLFEEQVAKDPERIALIFREQTMTYGQLDRRAQALGEELNRLGVGPEDRVAIIAERSIEMIVAVYGVLKAGAAYVPIDVDYPTDRISYMLEDSSPKAVLLYKAELLTDIPVIDLEESMNWVPKNVQLPKAESHNLAYLIYTSGTSGKPKGVMIENRNVVNYSIQGGNGVLRYASADKCRSIVSLTNFVFDIFVTELILAPILGMTVVLADGREQVDAGALRQLLIQHPVDIMQTTPSRVQLYLSQEHGEDALKSFSYIMLGGEAVSAQLVNRLHRINPSAVIVDVYGPSETTVWSTCADVTYGDVTIGTAITNTQIYILNGVELCPEGVAGELCIAGAGVARGYLNRPDLTEEKFISNPFGEGRLYRTGDLARWRPDGNLEFLGRIDEQVKIRGTRIELGEIDSVLRQLPHIRDCAVIAREDHFGEKALYAFLTSDRILDLNHVRSGMKEFLPECMIPAYFSQIESIPLNANGKLDKRALPSDAQLLTQDYVAPQNDAEALLCNIFAEVLNLQRVGVTDNFFDLGGHSLRLIRLLNRLESETQCSLMQRDVYLHPTPRDLAPELSRAMEGKAEPIVAHCGLSMLPASPAQCRLFYDAQLREDDYSYHLISVYHIAGDVSVDRLKSAFERMLQRNEILRTVFFLRDGVPYQRILPKGQMDFTVISDYDSEPEVLVSKWLRPFDLSRAPLLRAELIDRGQEYLLFVDMHHIISDGISEDLFCGELAALYDGKSLPEVKLQYKDYCLWLEKRDISEQRAYWLSEFETIPPALDIPLDHARSHKQSRNGAMIQLPLSETLSTSISNLARKYGSSEYMVFLSAAYILLNNYTRQSDLVIGSAFSGRTHADTEKMLGMFVSTLPIRCSVLREESYSSFLRRVRDLCFLAQENQDYPFETLVQELQLKRDPYRNPLFDVMLVMQSADSYDYRSLGLHLQPAATIHKGSTFDLTFNIEEADNHYVLSLQFSTDLFIRESAEHMLLHYATLLESIVSGPEREIEALSLISDSERRKLDEFNHTEAPYPYRATITDLFEEQVERTPDQTAIVCNGVTISYRELNRRANILASKLRSFGVGPNDLVGILCTQGIDRFVAIYGILKSGGAYVPIDPSYPEERIQYILADSCSKVLVCDSVPSFVTIPTICLRDCATCLGNGENLPHISKATDLAYCIYTSGTTGLPKAVMLEHHGVANLKSYFENTLHVKSGDRILQFANYVFDGSVWEMNMALLTGAQLILVTNQMDLHGIENLIKEYQVTVASFPPNYYAQMRDVSPKIIVTAGSASDRGIVEKARHCRYINSYGPTECTVAVSHWEGECVSSFVPLGKPLQNTQIYILNGTRLCGIGIPGEICIGGAGLARGYLNQPELTAQKFIPNPFGSGKLYRSGDIGLFMPDGNIRFLGRVDDQVKVRGYRVEPGEIDATIRKLPYIRDCAVVIRQDSSLQNAIFAYVVSEEKVTFDRLRSSLKKSLPDYMIPVYVMQLDRIPVTRNGKLDQKALPEMKLQSDSEYILPRTTQEQALVEALKDVLSLDTISVKDHFFELGGDSIKAIRVVSFLREIGYKITVQDIMENSTVEEIASFIEELNQNTYSQNEVVGKVGITPMLRLFRHWNLKKPEHFNQAIIIPTDASESECSAALNILVKHHDILRAVYDQDRLFVRPYEENSCFSFEVLSIPDNCNAAQWIESQCSKIQSAIRLKDGPLLKAAYFKLNGSSLIMIAIHHLVVDSVSWHILRSDFESAISQLRRNEPIHLPLKTASFIQWAELLEEYRNSEQLRAELLYWDQISSYVPDSKLEVPYGSSNEDVDFEISLTEQQTCALMTEACTTYNTQINDLLLAALAMSVHCLTEQPQIAVCLEGHGRESIHIPIDIDRTVGWFTCAYPVVLPCKGHVSEVIIETKEMLRKIPNHGIGFGLLYPPSYLDNISIFFNYIGESDESASLDQASYSAGCCIAHENQVGGPINFNGSIVNGAMIFSIHSQKGKYGSDFVEQLANRFKDMLLEILDHCVSSEETYQTYADVDAEDLLEEDFDEINAILGLT